MLFVQNRCVDPEICQTGIPRATAKDKRPGRFRSTRSNGSQHPEAARDARPDAVVSHCSARGSSRPWHRAGIRRLVVRMAEENPTWGYTRIVGTLKNVGHRVKSRTPRASTSRSIWLTFNQRAGTER